MAANKDPIASSIWLQPPRGRGEQALNRAHIVAAAIEILDADGLDGLSMRRLAGLLGAGATSLYWHVNNKEGLLDLALDEVMGEVELPESADWRTTLRTYGLSIRAAILRHPWVTGLLGVRPNFGPNSLRLSDRTIGALTSGGYSGLELTYATSLMSCHAVGAAAVESAYRLAAAHAGKTPGEMLADMEQSGRQIFADYPNIAAWEKANSGYDSEEVYQTAFEFGVDRALDGLAAWLEQTKKP
jgi:AcrR family transcriptional regulator